jgi:hypothetical protein
MSRDYLASFEFDGTLEGLIKILQKIKDENKEDVAVLADVSSSIRDVEIGSVELVEHYGKKVVIRLE